MSDLEIEPEIPPDWKRETQPDRKDDKETLMPGDDDLLDGCDIDFTIDPTPDDESDLYVIFAEALDPNNPKTIEEVEAEWA